MTQTGWPEKYSVLLRRAEGVIRRRGCRTGVVEHACRELNAGEGLEALWFHDMKREAGARMRWAEIVPQGATAPRVDCLFGPNSGVLRRVKRKGPFRLWFKRRLLSVCFYGVDDEVDLAAWGETRRAGLKVELWKQLLARTL